MTDRSEALARLAALGVTNDVTDVPLVEQGPEPTGDEVYAGGDTARILIKAAHLAYYDKELRDLVRPEAKVGDTVLLSDVEAKRLDGLGATMTKAKAKAAAKPTPVEVPSVPEGDPSAGQPDGTPATTSVAAGTSGKTDEELAAMGAEELVAHVNQHQGDKVRVRALEGQRPKPRSTVLKATAPEGDDPDEELD